MPAGPPNQDPFFQGNPNGGAAPTPKSQGTPLPEEELPAMDPFADDPGAAGAPQGPPAPAADMGPADANDPFADEPAAVPAAVPAAKPPAPEDGGDPFAEPNPQ